MARNLHWIDRLAIGVFPNWVDRLLAESDRVVVDIFNIGGRGTKNAKSQCGTGSDDQKA
jgi:hypothetical protein